VALAVLVPPLVQGHLAAPSAAETAVLVARLLLAALLPVAVVPVDTAVPVALAVRTPSAPLLLLALVVAVVAVAVPAVAVPLVTGPVAVVALASLVLGRTALLAARLRLELVAVVGRVVVVVTLALTPQLADWSPMAVVVCMAVVLVVALLRRVLTRTHTTVLVVQCESSGDLDARIQATQHNKKEKPCSEFYPLKDSARSLISVAMLSHLR
jgi:hypothetical protein